MRRSEDMMNRKIITFLILILLLTCGCATIPSGPSVMVLPPPGKPFEVFQADDAICRQWAARQIGQSPQETVNQNALTGAVVGTAIGAGIGAALGSASGDMGSGAALGAASGLILGTASGADSARVYGWEAQRRYDIAYQQCMYSKGNQIPGTVTQTRTIRRIPPPPPPGSGYTPPTYAPQSPATPPPAQ
jgi:hypothetical protein